MTHARWPCGAACGLLLGLLGGQPAPGWGEEGKVGPAPLDGPTESGGELSTAPAHPRFALAGTVLVSEKRAALITLLDDRQNEVGSRLVSEGDTIQGFRLVRIGPDRVWLERGGQRFVSRLGSPPQRVPAGGSESSASSALGSSFIPLAPGQRVTPRMPFAGSTDLELGSADTRPPADLERDRKQAETMLERLMGSPAFRKELEELRPLMQQRSGLPADPGSPTPGGPPGPAP